MGYILQVSKMPVDALRVAMAALGPAAEETIVTTGEMLMEKGRAEGEQEGRAEGRAESVLSVLQARGVSVTAAERSQVLACRDVAALDRWLLAAVTAKSSRDVLG